MNRDAEELFVTIRRFLETYLPLQRGSSPNTVRSYRTTLRQFVDYLVDEEGIRIDRLTFSSITEGSLAGYLDKVESSGCSVATRNQRLAAIKSFLSFAAAEDIANVALLARAGRVPQKKAPRAPVEYLSEEQLAALLNQPDATTRMGLRDLDMLVMLYDTAARIRELLGIRLMDLHLGAHPYVVLHGKGQKVRSVPLMKRTVELNARYMREYHPTRVATSTLFYTVIGGERRPMSYENASKMVAKYGALAAKDCDEFPARLHAHTLRHTRSMHLYQDGVPLSYIKDLLGHSNINTTSIYASADLDMLRRAMAPLDKPLETFAPLPDWESEKDRLMKLAGLR